ncbi:MAG: hypothetical protein ILP16_03310 [Spirochaetales bacterium]|nr:hypothetical protein [Spirochaetales bacterium]
MKKLLVIICLVASVFGFVFAANPELIKADKDVFVTSFGQNADSEFVKVLAKRIKLDIQYLSAGKPSDVDWTKTRTMICVLGGSGKGLGQAGLDTNSELARCDSLLSEAKNANATVIGLHLGGEDRLGPTSQAFLPYAKDVDYMIVKEEQGVVEYFKPVCEAAGVPLYVIKTTSELSGVLKDIFSL